MQRKVRNSMPLKETVFVPLASSQMPGATPPSSKYDFSRTRVKKKSDQAARWRDNLNKKNNLAFCHGTQGVKKEKYTKTGAKIRSATLTSSFFSYHASYIMV